MLTEEVGTINEVAYGGLSIADGMRATEESHSEVPTLLGVVITHHKLH